jgi:hypothetical protein
LLLGDWHRLDRLFASQPPRYHPPISFKVRREDVEHLAQSDDGGIARVARQIMADDAERRERELTGGPGGFLAELPNGVLPHLLEVLPEMYAPSGMV